LGGKTLFIIPKRTKNRAVWKLKRGLSDNNPGRRKRRDIEIASIPARPRWGGKKNTARPWEPNLNKFFWKEKNWRKRKNASEGVRHGVRDGKISKPA